MRLLYKFCRIVGDKDMKRLLSVALAVVMLLSLVPFTASAQGEKLIAVTFDDGPSSNTAALLDGLNERGVKASFFVQGHCAERYPELVRRIWSEGHQLCSHTYDHKLLTGLSTAAIKEQMEKTDSILDSALGWNADYILRPPYGGFNQTVLDTVGVPCIYWSVDTRDWESLNADSVYRQFVNAARDGSVVLLHDLYKSSVEGALRAIDRLLADGYEFVTISELFYRRGITLSKGSIYYNAYPQSYGTASGIAEPVIETQIIDGAMYVSISGDTRGDIYYTTDGTEPTPKNSTKYTGSFRINADCTVRAVSVIDWNGLRSDTVSKQIRDIPTLTPQISIARGKVSMSCQTSESRIYYTTDGSEPTEESLLYTGELMSLRGTTYKARAYSEGHSKSGLAMLTYTERGNLFEDIYIGQWCCEAVDEAVSEGLFLGVTPRQFRPQDYITRAQLVSVLWRVSGKPAADVSADFSDIPADHWAYDAISWASSEGVSVGYPDGSFLPLKPVTRAQLVTMLYRLSGEPDCEGTLPDFTDADEIGDFARAALIWACENGIISGFDDGALRPNEPCTRAQAAVILTRLW